MNGASINTSDFMVGSGSVTLSAASSQYVQIPSFTIGSTGLSFSCWFRTDTICGWIHLFDFGDSSQSDDIRMLFSCQGLGPSVLKNSNEEHYNDDFSEGVIAGVSDNVWRHMVWSLSPGGTWVVYVNGVNIWVSQGRSYPNVIQRGPNYLGANYFSNPFFNGALDDFRMYNSVLTQSDVSALFTGEFMCIVILTLDFISSLT